MPEEFLPGETRVIKNRWVLSAACVALLCACSPSSKQVAEPAAPAKPEIALYAIDCGKASVKDADMFADDGSFKGQARDLVDPCYLIRHPSGDLLWDLGLPDALATTPLNDPAAVFQLTRTVTLAAQLQQLGLTPADIEFISISHSHFDHVGNGNAFAGATFLIDAEERATLFSEEARKTAEFANYAALEQAKSVSLEGEGDHDVFGDGSVKIIAAPGHTPGHRVLLVDLAQAGPVLLSGDMYHLPESRERRTVPRFNTDRAQTLLSVEKIEKLVADTGARVVRQHVPEDFTALPVFPEPLK